MNKLLFTFVFCTITYHAKATGPQIVKIFHGLEEVSPLCRETNKSLSQVTECEKSTKKGKSYDVYADSKSKKIIGKLEIFPGMSGGFEFFYSTNGKSKDEFNLSNLIYDCKKDNHSPEFLVSKKDDGDFVTLPIGPWGEQGWIKEDHTDLLHRH